MNVDHTLFFPAEKVTGCGDNVGCNFRTRSKHSSHRRNLSIFCNVRYTIKRTFPINSLFNISINFFSVDF